MPSISFVVLTYNREQRLRRTLSQLLPQSNNHEVIICDNASMDGTRDYLLGMAPHHPNLVYKRNAINVGYARNLFSGFAAARGSHVVFLADDDDIPLGYVDEIASLITAHPLSPLLIPTRRRLTADGIVFSTGIEKTEYVPASMEAVRWAFNNSGAVPGITVRVDAVHNSDWKLDGTIYPQIGLAARLAARGGVVKAAMENSIICGDDDGISVRIKDAMKRPSDYGVIERAQIADSLDVSSPDKLKATLWWWAFDVFKEMQRASMGHYAASVYLKALLASQHCGQSASFFAIWLRMARSDRSFMAASIGRVFSSLPRAMFSNRFWSSLFSHLAINRT